MMLIDCPWCGARNQDEFSCGGQAHIERPQQPESVSDRTWAEYQFVRLNSCGLHFERWQHIYGCGQWFHMTRDTRTHEIKAIYLMHEDPPEGLQ
jgi:sarcosine oxidase subunit delta